MGDEERIKFTPDGKVIMSADFFKLPALKVDWDKVLPLPSSREFDSSNGKPVQVKRVGTEVHFKYQSEDGTPLTLTFDIFTVARLGDFLIGLQLDMFDKLSGDSKKP